MSEAVESGRRVAIVGFANSKEATPWDQGFEVWSLNELWYWFQDPAHPERYWTRWYELHGMDVVGDTTRNWTPDKAKHLAWMKALPAGGKPLYMQQVYPDMPASVRFPFEELNARFTRAMPFFQRYWTNSISFMMAHAMAEGRDEQFKPDGSGQHVDWIGLFGVDLAGDTEYVYQRPNAEMFAGFAAGIGIEVYCEPTSAMFKGECVYGYENSPADTEPLSRQYFVKHLEELQKEHQKHTEMMGRETAIVNTLHGAIQEASNSLKLLQLAPRGVRTQNLFISPAKAVSGAAAGKSASEVKAEDATGPLTAPATSTT